MLLTSVVYSFVPPSRCASPQVDLDLGNYERFNDITLTRDHNITTGKIYQSCLERERKGDYLGKTVQVRRMPSTSSESRNE